MPTVNYGDVVRIYVEGRGEMIGTVKVIDRNGTFFAPDVPSVDVYVPNERLFVKHYPISALEFIEHTYMCDVEFA